LVQRLYDRTRELDPHDRDMLKMPIADRLKHPLSVLVTWLSAVQPAFEEARVREDTDYGLEDGLLALEQELVLALEPD
jgi:hypothetical protein